MQKLTISLLCAGLITTTAIAEENCHVFFEAQNYQKSAQCFVQKLKKDRSSVSLGNAGISYCELGRYKEALPYLKEAEAKASNIDDFTVLYSWLSTVYAGIGEKDKELAYTMKSLDLSLKAGETLRIGVSYGNVGEYYRNQKQPQKALEYFEKSLEYLEESERATTYGNMALAYNDLKDYQKTEEMYQKAILVDQQTGAYASLGLHKSNLGIFYFIQGRTDEARSTLEDTLIIAQQANIIHIKSSILAVLARIDNQEGKIIQAKQKVDEALQLAKLSGSSASLTTANYAWKEINKK